MGDREKLIELSKTLLNSWAVSPESMADFFLSNGVTVQKHGRWAALDDDCEELEGEEEVMRWGCTACGEIVEYSDWTHKSLLTRYCPNCGAKMDLKENK